MYVLYNWNFNYLRALTWNLFIKLLIYIFPKVTRWIDGCYFNVGVWAILLKWIFPFNWEILQKKVWQYCNYPALSFILSMTLYLNFTYSFTYKNLWFNLKISEIGFDLLLFLTIRNTCKGNLRLVVIWIVKQTVYQVNYNLNLFLMTS